MKYEQMNELIRLHTQYRRVLDDLRMLYAGKRISEVRFIAFHGDGICFAMNDSSNKPMYDLLPLHEALGRVLTKKRAELREQMVALGYEFSEADDRNYEHEHDDDDG